MSWARFDDGYSDHPKVCAAGPWGELLDMRAIIWCARQETDGKVPESALSRLAHDIPKARHVVARLVEVGRWIQTDGGYEVVDFLDYNPSRAERDADRAAARERMANARERKRTVRGKFAGSSPEHPPNEERSSDNPDPTRPGVPSEHVPPGDADESSSPVNRLVGRYVTAYRSTHDDQDPSSIWRAQAGKVAKQALLDGEDESVIEKCFNAIARESKSPSVLTHVIADYHAARAAS